MTPAKTYACDGTMQPEADSGHDYSTPKPTAASGEEFCLGVIGPALLSVTASQIAVDRASDPDARDFANFELREAVAVVRILKELGIRELAPDEPGQAFVEKLKSTPRGTEFDKLYMTAELSNHEYLRDLAESFLSSPSSQLASEVHARHLASLAITAFKEHVVLSKNILRRLDPVR